jgi:hypothetical protein
MCAKDDSAPPRGAGWGAHCGKPVVMRLGGVPRVDGQAGEERSLQA